MFDDSSKWIDFMGTLTNLEYLDLSSNDNPMYLPECIGNLKNWIH
jgi:hypothetical protein